MGNEWEIYGLLVCVSEALSTNFHLDGERQSLDLSYKFCL